MAQIGGGEFFKASAEDLDITSRVTLLEHRLDLMIKAMIAMEDALQESLKAQEVNHSGLHRLAGKVTDLDGQLKICSALVRLTLENDAKK